MQRPKPNALDPVKHAFDLMIAAFANRDPRYAFAENLQLRRPRLQLLRFKIEPFRKSLDCSCWYRAVRLHQIDFRDFPLRIHELIRPLAVVRQQNKTR